MPNMEFKNAKDIFLRIQEDSGLKRPVILLVCTQNNIKKTCLGQFCGIVESHNPYVEIFMADDIRRIEIADIQSIKYVSVDSLLVAIDSIGIAARTILKSIENIA